MSKLPRHAEDPKPNAQGLYESVSKTEFVNQCRFVNADGTPASDDHGGEWTDICQGHNDAYKAIACGERSKALSENNRVPKDELDALLIAAVLSTKKKTKELGLTEQFRIVKRTLSVNEEIFEDGDESLTSEEPSRKKDAVH